MTSHRVTVITPRALPALTRMQWLLLHRIATVRTFEFTEAPSDADIDALHALGYVCVERAAGIRIVTATEAGRVRVTGALR